MFSRLPRGLPVRSSSRTDRPLTGGPYDPRSILLSAWSPASLSAPLRDPFRALSSLFATRRFATSVRRASFEARRPAGRLDRVPARSDRCCPARRSLVRGARRARPPPLVPHGTASAFPVLVGTAGLATLQGAQRVALGLPGTRGARPGGDPGPFDRCLLLTDSVLKELSEMMPKSRCTPQRLFPRAGGAPGFTPLSPLR
jgi:hypothetical protein